MEFKTNSPEQTQLVAKQLAQSLLKTKINTLLLLQGDYGTGKTTFVQGLAAGLNITTPLLSPSYVYMREYVTSQVKLIHVDFWRVKDLTTFEHLINSINFDADLQIIIAIEWPTAFNKELNLFAKQHSLDLQEITQIWELDK